MKELPIGKAVAALENAALLDPVIKVVKAVVDGVVRPQGLRDVLHGVPIGHALHPIQVQVPVGAWTCAAILDLLPGERKGARTLVGIGVLGAAPAILTGYTDWSQLHEQQQRVGIVHSWMNAAAVSLYALSYLQRRAGGNGKLLGFAGFAAVSASGYLGGHLAYRQAAGVNHAEDVPHRFPQGWQALAPLDTLPDGLPPHHLVSEVPLLAVRRGARVDVLANACSHLSGPLDQGELTEIGGEACITCPWHSSAYALETGEVVHGPSTAPQPRFETRVVSGLVEVLLPGAG